MRTVDMGSIGFVMENCEELWFTKEELTEFQIETSADVYKKIGTELVAFKAAKNLVASLDVTANHTYNSFGQPSAITTFQRLINSPNVVAVVIRTPDYDETFYFTEDGYFSIGLDDFGNLNFVYDEEGMVECCDCCDCDDCGEEVDF